MTLEKLITRDLRIGNVVQDENGFIMYVYRLWKDGAELASDMDGHDDIDYSEGEIFGVPLTEEWLVRFGFKETGDFLWLGNFAYNKETNQFHWYGVIIYDLLIKYVHQLQNLYFVLTGKELDFTL